MSSGKLTPEQLIELTQMALPKEIFEVSNRIHYSKWQTAERRIAALEAELAAEDKRRQALESRIDELIQQLAAANERASRAEMKRKTVKPGQVLTVPWVPDEDEDDD